MSRKADYVVKTPAERMRSCRRRQRDQWHSFRIEIAATQIDALVKRGYLDPKKRDDLIAVGHATTAFVSHALRDKAAKWTKR